MAHRLGLALGAIGAKQAAESGDTAAAGVQGTFAGLNGIIAIAGIGEVATYAATRIPGFITSTAGEALAATLGGAFGTVAGVAGVLAAVGGLIYPIVSSILADEKLHKQENAWYKELQDGFASAGLTLPPLGTLIDADNGSGPIDTAGVFPA
ncbi:MAG: hypothetical protein ACRYG8_07780 [Janthinobacterium lividum]